MNFIAKLTIADVINFAENKEDSCTIKYLNGTKKLFHRREE